MREPEPSRADTFRVRLRRAISCFTHVEIPQREKVSRFWGTAYSEMSQTCIHLMILELKLQEPSTSLPQEYGVVEVKLDTFVLFCRLLEETDIDQEKVLELKALRSEITSLEPFPRPNHS